MSNVYFDLTQEFNANGPIAALASGQAVVYYRLAITSKDRYLAAAAPYLAELMRSGVDAMALPAAHAAALQLAERLLPMSLPLGI